MEFPQELIVKGFPLYERGWNGLYTKTDEYSDDCPIYKLPSYKFFGKIEIIGLYLYKKNGMWIMRRECDQYPMKSYHKYGKMQDTPYGYWTRGIYVEANDGIFLLKN